MLYILYLCVYYITYHKKRVCNIKQSAPAPDVYVCVNYNILLYIVAELYRIMKCVVMTRAEDIAEKTTVI